MRVYPTAPSETKMEKTHDLTKHLEPSEKNKKNRWFGLTPLAVMSASPKKMIQRRNI
jgi:hypothetical protein